MGNGSNAKSMEEELTFLPMETLTQENTRMESPMGQVLTLGNQEAYMKEIFMKVLSMEKESGGRIKTISLLISMRVLIVLTKNMDMESLLGSQAISTKATITWMKEMDMEKCSSQMVLFIKVIGQEEFKQGMLKWLCLMGL